ncbi:MAG: prepilin-type N-terminal cleavage/methylation domain-containing protein [Planctomycetaceae bacterium]|jgi:prepilin-type N-terminal cleavage/methylation domain-containing protein|nr:prepilin-type N-terminal cleavage/methylation domain-containing protein [Planctomycetaceae bacterium]
MRRAFTLVELMVAMTLSLLLLLAVAKLFQGVGDTINDTQSTLNMSSNMNNVAMQLREDLDAIFRCVENINKPHDMVDGRDPADKGYLEIIEGDNNAITYVDENGAPDTTIGDVNDILMGTGKVVGANRKYRGLVNGEVCESDCAEIVWFVRGTTLYRQARLIIGDDGNLPDKYLYPPGHTDAGEFMPITNFHGTNDVAATPLTGDEYRLHKLADLARRENRFAHYYVGTGTFPFPHDPRYRELRLPTMAELDGGFTVSAVPTHPTSVDLWNRPNYAAHAVNSSLPEDARGNGWLATGSRAGEDIVLTNVISFDIKVWNPAANGGAGAFVDLGGGSAGAFGSGGRYSGGSGDDEILVQRVYFDENRDYGVPKSIPDLSIDPTGNTWVENSAHHDIGDKYLYREDKNGVELPLSNLPTGAYTPPTPPPSNHAWPTSTLEIIAWNGDRMPRTFDTWTKYYENAYRRGGEISDLSSDPPAPVSMTTNVPMYKSGVNRINNNSANDNARFTGTEYYLVTFGQEQLGSPPINRWHYEHSPNPNPDPPPDPKANQIFNTDFNPHPVTQRGMGVMLDEGKGHAKYWESPPPYDAKLRGIEITIRCFDPQSGNIRQVRVVRHVD